MTEEFLEALITNDLHTVKRLLCAPDPLDLHTSDEIGRNPLEIAIEYGYLDLLELLLPHLDIGDGLLYAIQVESTHAVQILCKSLPEAKEDSDRSPINNFAHTSVMFPPYMTPILLAAKLNHHSILRILLDHGAKMPSLQEVLQTVSEDAHERSVAHLAWYEAHSSDAYILLTSKDPIQTVFEMAITLKNQGSKFPQHKGGYEKLSKNLEDFVTALLQYFRNGEELDTVLWAGEEDDYEELPPRLIEAIKLNLKGFVSHPYCQEYSLIRWYNSSTRWRKMSSATFCIWSTLVCLLFPFISIIYILMPWTRLARKIKAPYVRFLLHTASRWTFIGLLIYKTLAESSSITYPPESLQEVYIHHTGPPPDVVDYLLYVCILGMTWKEFRQCRRSGIKKYINRKWNWLGLCQLLLYWISLLFTVKAHIAAKETYNDVLKDNSELTLTMPSPSPTDDTRFIYDLPPFILASSHFCNESRYNWDWNHPSLIAEATFSVATVLTCLSMLRILVLFESVGPLQIALTGMLCDVLWFLLLFCIIWISFALGLTFLYQPFGNAGVRNDSTVCWSTLCNEDEELMPLFNQLWRSLGTLFWSIFDMPDLDDLQIGGNNLHLTKIVGLAMYAVFMVIAVVILMNALIAVMNNAYNKLQNTAVTEWKVSRTRLVYEYSAESSTLPPPFNLIPTMKDIYRCLKYLKDSWESNIPQRKIKRLKRLSQSLSVQRYKAVVQNLSTRYMFDKRTTRIKETRHDRLQTQINQLRNDLNRLQKKADRLSSSEDLIVHQEETSI